MDPVKDTPTITPPSSSLPPLPRLLESSGSYILEKVHALRSLYFPTFALISHPLLLKKRHRRAFYSSTPTIPDSGYASASEDADEEEEEDAAEMLRADPFEREFAIKWLTQLVSVSDDWAGTKSPGEDASERLLAVEEASDLLCAFLPVDHEPEAAVTRTFKFDRGGAGASMEEVMVELNDAPLSNDDHTSVGLQSWASSIVLSRMICSQPDDFFFNVSHTAAATTSRSVRILELGAGTGLLSITAAKVLRSEGYSPIIVATDYHPDVLRNLALNIRTNFPSAPDAVTVHRLDWEKPEYLFPLDEPFDVVLAGDVIYHPDHPGWIKGCVERLLARPSSRGSGDGGLFWLIIPRRSTGRHDGLHNTVDAVFCREEGTEGPCLVIKRRAEFERRGNDGRADEDGYRVFQIDWDCE